MPFDDGAGAYLPEIALILAETVEERAERLAREGAHVKSNTERIAWLEAQVEMWSALAERQTAEMRAVVADCRTLIGDAYRIVQSQH